MSVILSPLSGVDERSSLEATKGQLGRCVSEAARRCAEEAADGGRGRRYWRHDLIRGFIVSMPPPSDGSGQRARRTAPGSGVREVTGANDPARTGHGSAIRCGERRDDACREGPVLPSVNNRRYLSDIARNPSGPEKTDQRLEKNCGPRSSGDTGALEAGGIWFNVILFIDLLESKFDNLAYSNPSPSSHGSAMVRLGRKGLLLTKKRRKNV